MEAKRISLRDGRTSLQYYEAGQVGSPLLFLHGWCIDGKYWEKQLAHFQADHRVYALDLPGFGGSTAERTQWSIEEYARDVLEFMEVLNLRDVVLIGHSMSEAIILETALSGNTRVKGLVGIDNFSFIDVQWPEEQAAYFFDFVQRFATDFRNAAPQYAREFLFQPSTPPDVIERVVRDFKQSDPTISNAVFQNLMQFSATEPEKLEQLPYRLHLLNSDATPTNEAGLRTRCRQGYELHTIHATGHYPMIEKPAEFNRILGEVLQKMG